VIPPHPAARDIRILGRSEEASRQCFAGDHHGIECAIRRKHLNLRHDRVERLEREGESHRVSHGNGGHGFEEVVRKRCGFRERSVGGDAGRAKR